MEVYIFMKKFTASAITLLATLTLAGCSSSSEDVATIGDNGSVSKEEFYEAMKSSVGENTLQRLILTEVLENEVGKNDYKSQAEAEVLATMESVGGQETFLGLIQQMGFATQEEYTSQIHLNLLMDDALRDRTSFTDEEVQAYYDTYEPNITASHILVEDEDLAKDLIKQINEGADFAELAAENSTDGTAQNGGSLGSFGKGQMVAEFEEAAFALEEGEMSQTPVKTEHGYHIILVTEKPEKGTFEEEEENVKELMMNEKLSDSAYLDEVMTTIMKDADINIKDADLKNAMDAFLGETEEVEESTEEDAATEESATEESATEESAETESAETESAE